jgi:hypothetical protein
MAAKHFSRFLISRLGDPYFSEVVVTWFISRIGEWNGCCLTPTLTHAYQELSAFDLVESIERILGNALNRINFAS